MGYRLNEHRPWTPFLLSFALQASMVLSADESLKELTIPQDRVFVAKFDGTEQRYVIQLPQGFDANRPHDLMIALHGHGSDRWQFVNQDRGECRAARDAAAKYQMIYVSPDYRAKTSWMGPAAEADLLQIIDDLNQSYRIDNVVLCGGSMGGTSALAFTAMHPEHVDAVVSLNGTANLVEYDGFPEAIAESYGGTRTEKPDVYRMRSAELFPERFTMPLSITTGGLDTIVAPASALRLAEALTQRGSPVKLIHRPEGGHETSYADSMEAFQFAIEQSRAANEKLTPLLTFDDTPRKIVCLGDSVTGVYYHTGGRRAYPEMLQLALNRLFPKTPLTVINAGISGQTTQDGLERLERDVLSHHPDLVTISFGLNDMTRIPPETFRANLESLIQRCREKDSQVLLCTPNAVIDTAGRPIEKLVSYCEIIRLVGQKMSVPVCDQYSAGTRLKTRAPWAWRLTLSDEIHPNMDGHKRMAEELCRSISAKSISLDPVGPPRPSLVRTKSLLKQGQPVRVLAMAPYDGLIGEALKVLDKDAKVEVTTWSVAGKSLADLEKEANQTVRMLKPDLVVLSVPRSALAAGDGSTKSLDSIAVRSDRRAHRIGEYNETVARSYSWVMNWSLSFGQQEWDCLVIHPSVAEPGMNGPYDELCRRLAWAQDVDTLDRSEGDQSSTAALLADWFVKRLND